MICKVCNQNFASDKLFNYHLRQHKLTIAEYYQTHEPRYDKLDGSLILFKSKDFYLENDFNSQSNLSDWIKKTSKSIVSDYIINWLKKRKERKNLLYTPCQVELRSLHMPGINFLSTLFDDYYDMGKSIGFENKFEKFLGWNNKIILNKKRKIFIDTREKKPLIFTKVKSETRTLSYGDYSFSDEEWSGNIIIERKSLNDFIGTLSTNLERFKKELDRAKADGAYLIILVEEKLGNILDFDNRCKKRYHFTINPEYTFHKVRTLIQEYPNIQFLFSDSHSHSAQLVETLFSLGNDIKKFDLQLLRDSNLI